MSTSRTSIETLGNTEQLLHSNQRDQAGPSDKVEMKQEIGIIKGVSIIVGSVIGSGIFVTSRGVLGFSGQSVGISLLLWFVSGLISLIGALCYAELGLTIRSSGGEYAYLKEAFGNTAAFLQLWVNILILRPIAQAIVALTFATYALQPIYNGCTPPTIAVQLLAALAISLLTWLNATSVVWATRVQVIFLVAKLIALAIIITTGIVLLCMGMNENFENAFETQTPVTPGDIALALYAGSFAFGGWNQLNYVTEEIKNPARNLPGAIYISMAIVTSFYVLVNVAYFTLLTPMQVMVSDAVAVTFAELIYGRFSWLIPLAVSLSCFGGINGILFTSGRLCYVGAREGHLPSLIAMLHIKKLTPVPAILVSSLLSLIVLLSPNLGKLITYLAFVQWLSVGGSVAGMLWMRRTRPDIERILKLHWMIPALFLCTCIFLLIIPLFTEPVEFLIGLAIVLTGVPVYLILIKWDKTPRSLKNFYYNIENLGQKIMFVVKPG